MIYDSHVHLSEPEYTTSLPHIMGVCEQAGIRCVSVSTNIETSRKTLELADAYRGSIIPFIGIHPWGVDESWLDELTRLSTIPRVRGIGEIGLDGLAIKEKNEQPQIRAFRFQLEVAEKMALPVSIHSRDAVKPVLEILSSYSIERVVLHWFSGEPSELQAAQSRGHYVSFGPSILYSKRSIQLASLSSTNLVLVESDGPVAYGEIFGGSPATPICVPSVIYQLSVVWKRPYDEVQRLVETNTSAFLGEV